MADTGAWIQTMQSGLESFLFSYKGVDMETTMQIPLQSIQIDLSVRGTPQPWAQKSAKVLAGHEQ